MSFSATVLRVLIASPGDLVEEREIIPEVIHDWNAIHADENRTVLLPVKWETHSVPEMGDRPQAILNRRIVADCDILIGAFWTKLGTPTGVADSGTLEEIEEFSRAGKPVMLYFSSRLIDPNKIDWEQWQRVRAARERFKERGLFDQFASPDDLRAKLARQLHQQVRRLIANPGRPDTVPQQSHAPPSAEIIVPEPSVPHGRERANGQVPGMSERELLYQAYWQAFKAVLTRSGSRIRSPTVKAKNYVRFPAGGASARVNAFASTRERYLGVELVLARACENIFNALQAQRADIESEIGSELEWTEHPRSYRIVVTLHGHDPADRTDWARQHEWLSRMLEQYNRVLVTRVRRGSGAAVMRNSDRNGPVFNLKLQQTYFLQGFFNVVVEYDQYVRKTDGPIRLRLGRQGPEIQGKINRRANTNGTARIYGGPALREWFQGNFEPMETVLVDLSSEDVIVLDRSTQGAQASQSPTQPPSSPLQ